MKRMILFFIGVFLFCGCAVLQNSARVDQNLLESSHSGKSFPQIQKNAQKPAIKNKSVFGTFGGDKGVSDDF